MTGYRMLVTTLLAWLGAAATLVAQADLLSVIPSDALPESVVSGQFIGAVQAMLGQEGAPNP